MTGVAPYLDNTSSTYPTAPIPTLASLLGEAGYVTAGISGNHILYRPFNVTAGFQEMDTYANNPLGLSKGAQGIEVRLPGCSLCGGATRELTEVALKWVRRNGDKPFFLWLHYLDPHYPYAPPLEYLSNPSDLDELRPTGTHKWTPRERSEMKRLYETEVRYVDDNLGRLFGGLREIGLYEEAVILLTSDHGEEFWERGNLGHETTLHWELLHVPLIVKLPDGAVRRRITSHVPTQALMSTVLELCGVSAPEAPGRARPFTHLLQMNAEDIYEDPIISSGVRRAEPQRAVIVDGFKYIYRLDSDREELYNLALDPTEAHSVAGEFPAVVERAREILAQHEEISASLRDSMSESTEHDPEEALRRLRALGYVQ
jgi:arylsulfatase A-like enzyme